MKYKITGQTEIPKQFDDIISSRVMPLLDTAGVQTRTLEHLMKEAYRIGFLDAVDVFQKVGR